MTPIYTRHICILCEDGRKRWKVVNDTADGTEAEPVYEIPAAGNAGKYPERTICEIRIY